jgi:hypothetical protein
MTGVEELNISSEGIRKNAHLSTSLSHDVKHEFCIAFVMPTKLQYGMSRVWQAYADPDSKNSRIFENREAADQWIESKLGR